MRDATAGEKNEKNNKIGSGGETRMGVWGGVYCHVGGVYLDLLEYISQKYGIYRSSGRVGVGGWRGIFCIFIPSYPCPAALARPSIGVHCLLQYTSVVDGGAAARSACGFRPVLLFFFSACLYSSLWASRIGVPGDRFYIGRYVTFLYMLRTSIYGV